MAYTPLTIPGIDTSQKYAGPTVGGFGKQTTPATAPLSSPFMSVAPKLPQVDTKAPIPAASLPSSTTTYPTPAQPQVASTALASNLASAYATAENDIKQAETAAETPPAPAETGLKASLAKILGLSEDLAGKSGRAFDIQQEEGVFTKKKEATRLNNEILAKTKYYDKQIEEVKKNTQGKFGQAVNQDVANLERQKNSELADLAIQAKVANDDYAGAFEIAKAKVDAEFEPIQAQIDTLKDYYQLAQNDMSESEKLKAQTEIKRQEDELAFNRQKELYKYKQQIDQSDPLYQANLAKARDTTGSGTLNGKPQTTTQAQVQGYADRTATSSLIIDTIGDKFTGASSLVGAQLPNLLKTSERQQFEQAQRNFVNAVLRRESGAVISNEEFANARVQYFPQPGDSADVLKQKAANREQVINSLYQQANVARSALPGQLIEGDDGKTYKVGIDGETLEEV